MKQAILYYVCDEDGCDETTPECPRWADATKAANDAGWQLGEYDYCPEHKVVRAPLAKA